jgi:hypothetical protein
VRDAAETSDAVRSRVIRCKGEADLPETKQLPRQIVGPAIQVLDRVKSVANSEVGRRPRHQLGQAAGPGRGHGIDPISGSVGDEFVAQQDVAAIQIERPELLPREIG